MRFVVTRERTRHDEMIVITVVIKNNPLPWSHHISPLIDLGTYPDCYNDGYPFGYIMYIILILREVSSNCTPGEQCKPIWLQITDPKVLSQWASAWGRVPCSRLPSKIAPWLPAPEIVFCLQNFQCSLNSIIFPLPCSLLPCFLGPMLPAPWPYLAPFSWLPKPDAGTPQCTPV